MNDRDIAKHLRSIRFFVTGGMGSFGNLIVKDLLLFDSESIHICSRGEFKY